MVSIYSLVVPIIIIHVHAVLSTPILSQAQNNKGTLHKRYTFQHGLRALYVYKCPGEHLKSREFEWHAAWRSEDEMVSVNGLRNIQFIQPLIVIAPQFFTTWVGTHCESLEHKVCNYVYTGETQGTVTATGMTLILTEVNEDKSRLPQVSVHCIDRADIHGQYDCGPILLGENVHMCKVEIVRVNVLY